MTGGTLCHQLRFWDPREVTRPWTYFHVTTGSVSMMTQLPGPESAEQGVYTFATRLAKGRKQFNNRHDAAGTLLSPELDADEPSGLTRSKLYVGALNGKISYKPL